MAQSLLAFLYPRIKGSQEDLATYSLQYIVSNSECLNNSFCQLLAEKLHLEPETWRFTCQASGEEQERPDMSGKDEYGVEKILCEAKFYAGLTKNQPGKYLDRLLSNNGNGLAFICPKKRIVSLWGKLLELCADRKVKNISGYCVSVDGMPMTILSWDEVLFTLHTVAAAQAQEHLSDIEQLSGFCAEMDKEAFVPFKEEELGPDMAKSIERYYTVLDALVDKLNADKSLSPSLKGLKATAYRTGYVRYINLMGHAVEIRYDRDMWRKSMAETPLWLSVRGSDWKHSDEVDALYYALPNKEKSVFKDWTHKALYIPAYSTLDEITDSLKDQIVSFIGKLFFNAPF